jgi:DNA mismatch repair protein MutS
MTFLSPEQKGIQLFQLDNNSKITPVMQQWFFLKKQYPECVLFFRMGDFYELFYDDAKNNAPLLDLKLTSRGTDENDSPIPLAGIPVKALNEYLQKLIELQIPIAVAEQLPEPVKMKGKEFFMREISHVVTPGTVLDPSLVSQSNNNYLMAICYANGSFGISCADVTTGEFYLNRFDSLSDLLDEIFKIQPSEIILPVSLLKKQEFIDEFKNNFPNMYISEKNDFEFDYSNSYANLISFFNVQSLDGFGISEKFKIGIIAAGTLLTTLKHRKIPFVASKIQDQSSITSSILQIDSIARKNLELEQNLRDSTTKGTLLEVLDQTATPMGARILRNWLKNPLTKKNSILSRLEIVEKILHDYAIREDLIAFLRKLTDLERICTKIFYRGATPKDLSRLHESLLLLPSIQKILQAQEFDSLNHNSLFNEILTNITSVPEVTRLIEEALNQDSTNTLEEGTIIKNGFNFDLDELRRIIRDSKEILQEFEQNEQLRVAEVAKQQNSKESKLKVDYTRGHGYYIELKSSAPVPSDYTIARSLKDRTRYTTPKLLALANKLLTAEEDIKNLENQIYKELLARLIPFVKKIQEISNYLAQLDVLLTFSHVSNGNNYIKPEIIDEAAIQIIEGRHPIIEKILHLGEFVPNDTTLNNSDNQLLIISGANMGGKSTYLRQVALITILAQIGCFVPATQAKIGIVDRIFTRVGIVDDIWRGQSHFMIEMNETANILNNATSKSLVLLDEIGRGTSTNTGLSIAWAVAKYLHEHVKCRTLFATHFHQLNEMEKKFAGIHNYHLAVLYENNKLTFLRKVVKGGTDESYGLEVAELAGFPPGVIVDARNTRELIDEERFFQSLPESVNQEPVIREVKKEKYEKKPSFKQGSSMKSLAAFMKEPNQLELEKILKNTDVNTLTPVEALNLIAELKKLVK